MAQVKMTWIFLNIYLAVNFIRRNGVQELWIHGSEERMETALEKESFLPPCAALGVPFGDSMASIFGSDRMTPEFHPPSYTGQMSGVEIIAGKVLADGAAAVGKQVAADRREMQQAVIAAAKESEHMTAAGDALAKRAAMNQVVKTGIVQTLYRPIARMLRISSEYFENGFHEDIAGKLADVPESERIAPKPNVAAPAMEGLALNLEEPDLKEMYRASWSVRRTDVLRLVPTRRSSMPSAS